MDKWGTNFLSSLVGTAFDGMGRAVGLKAGMVMDILIRRLKCRLPKRFAHAIEISGLCAWRKHDVFDPDGEPTDADTRGVPDRVGDGTHRTGDADLAYAFRA